MSFFDTEEAHAVMLAYAAYGGPVNQGYSGPGSSGKSRLKAPAQFGVKKRYPYPSGQRRYGAKAIIENAESGVLGILVVSLRAGFLNARFKKARASMKFTLSYMKP